jgi:hypothetical protein
LILLILSAANAAVTNQMKRRQLVDGGKKLFVQFDGRDDVFAYHRSGDSHRFTPWRFGLISFEEGIWLTLETLQFYIGPTETLCHPFGFLVRWLKTALMQR